MAEASNTEAMATWPNMAEVLAVAVVIQVEQPLVMVLEVYSAQVAQVAAAVPNLALLVGGVVPGVSMLSAVAVL